MTTILITNLFSYLLYQNNLVQYVLQWAIMPNEKGRLIEISKINDKHHWNWFEQIEDILIW